jgi:hypothetical protein
MTIEQRTDRALREVARRVEAPLVDVVAVRVAARRRHRRRVVLSAVPVVAAVAILAVLLGARNPKAGPPEPVVPPPGLAMSGVPVWYDAAGLHRGEMVEQTAVDLLRSAAGDGVLALVRRGALYNDSVTHDIWFHPWGGEPRVVGHGSFEGPSGDPMGNVAAWFEGSELVVFDTLTGRVVAREHEDHVVCDWAAREGLQGNGFKHVSPFEVVWHSCGGSGPWRVWRYDVASGVSSEIKAVSPGRTSFVAIDDVHDGSVVYWRTDYRDHSQALVVSSSDHAPHTHDDLDLGRLSPDGGSLLAAAHAGRRGATVVIDVRTGAEWRLWREHPAFVAWSYGRIAMASGDTVLRACDVGTHACEDLDHRGPVLLPQS